MDILVIVQSHSDMRNLLSTKENQITLLKMVSVDMLMKESMLLVGISRNDISSHAITKLCKAATVNTFAACSTPKVRFTWKGNLYATCFSYIKQRQHG